jgi:AAA15 family ATPase/GTPase
MTNFLNTLSIENFKSIKNMAFDCKRINVFIGEPNVGKSNILEAIALLGAEHYINNPNKVFQSIARYEHFYNLFYYNDTSKNVLIDAKEVFVHFSSDLYNQNRYNFYAGSQNDFRILISRIKNENPREIYDMLHTQLSLKENKLAQLYLNIDSDSNISDRFLSRKESKTNPIKKYQFVKPKFEKNVFPEYLLPPFGDNFFAMVDRNAEWRKEIVELFHEYDLEIVADKNEAKFEMQRKSDGYYVDKIPYSLIADTFQRLFFYYAAIDSNKDSVLILEEPEVHSFPPFTLQLANRIINSSSNQFFIATHSPYLLQNLISEVDFKDLNVFITYYENYETKVKALSQEQLRDVSDSSMDIFFNLKNFI